MLPRAITSDEHTRIQIDGQWVEVLAAIPTPATIYTARVNGAPTSTDQLAQLTYDGGSGTLANVKVGMTILVGSSAGAYDKGQARIRKAPTSTIFYIGTESEISVSDNDYLTVLDEQGLWQKRVKIASGVIYMDEDVAYSDQNTNRLPVVTMGGPAVLELLGTTASAHFDATSSWVPGGGSKTYLWAAPGASAISSTSASTFDATYNAAGRYRVSCTVTIGGVTNTRYEWVQVFDADNPPVTQFQVRTITGSKSQGGYTFQMTLYAEAGITTVRDRAQVILWTRDHYGSQGQISTGYATGRENILCVGWIAGETIVWSPEQSSVTFQVEGAHAWLGRITAYPQGLEDVTTTPAQWIDYNTLTMTAFLWSLLVWRSTVAQAIDCIVETSTTRIIEMSAAATSLWEQIAVTAGQRLQAPPCTDHLSRLFVLIDSQMRSDRSGVAEVMTLGATDWRTPIQLNRNPLSNTSMVDLSGFVWDGTTATALFSLSPGHVWKRYGRVQSVQAQLLTDQSQANTLAGLIAGQANNDYPSVQIQLAGNNRMLDIAPDCYALLTLAASDTPRGVSFTGKRLIPRAITWNWDAASGGLLPTVTFEGESTAEIAVTGDAPATEPIPPPNVCPPGYHWDGSTCVIDNAPPPPPGQGDGNLVYVFIGDGSSDGPTRIYRSRNFLTTPPTWEDVTGAITGDILDACLDPGDPKHTAYVVTSTDVWMTSNLDDAAPTWTSVYSVSALGGGYQLWSICSSIVPVGSIFPLWVGASNSSNHKAYAVYSVDQFATNTASLITTGSSSGAGWMLMVSGNNGDDVFSVGVNNINGFQTMFGASPTAWADVGGFAGGFQACLSGDVSYDITLIPPNAVRVVMMRSGSFFVNTGAGWTGHSVSDTTTGLDGPRAPRLVNIATNFASDIMLLEPLSGLAHIKRSTDTGTTWSTIASYTGTDWTDACALGRWPYNRDWVFLLTGYYRSDGGKIYFSQDGGVTLQDKTGNLTGAFYRARHIIPVWVA